MEGIQEAAISPLRGLTRPRTRDTFIHPGGADMDPIGNTQSIIADLHPGEHVCGLYSTDDDQCEFLVRFIRQAIQNGEKILYIVNVQTAAQLKAKVAAAQIDVDALLTKGQLVILTAKDTYLKDGEFNPDKMTTLLRAETERALADGYPALRSAAEMMWALAGEPGSERLIEYESRLNSSYPHPKLYALCQYDHRRFDAELLLDVLHTHPKVVVDKRGFDNSRMYFVPPEGFLGTDRLSAMLDQWLQNLSMQQTSG
jgi:hypothetical protein